MLRRARLLATLKRSGDVADYGDVLFDPPTPTREPVTGIIAPAVLVNAVRADIGRVPRDDRFPVVIGGECPLLLGCLAAARDAHDRAGLLFVDGHEDVWPPHTSSTGEAADMALGFALGLTTAGGIDDVSALLPLVRSDDVVVLGPRDREEQLAAGVPSVAATVTFRDDAALHDGDLAATVNLLLDRLHAGAGHWWFHLDLDVLATDALAAVRYPQPGGLEWTHLETMTETALRAPGLAGWNITIYNPDLDLDGSGAARIVAFLGAMTRFLV